MEVFFCVIDQREIFANWYKTEIIIFLIPPETLAQFYSKFRHDIHQSAMSAKGTQVCYEGQDLLTIEDNRSNIAKIPI